MPPRRGPLAMSCGRDRGVAVVTSRRSSSHVLEAEQAYVVGIGRPAREARASAAGDDDRMMAIRSLALATMADRARGVPLPPNPRRKAAIWSVRYFARRSAWHALDHAWEIEDRVL